ncbi:alkaline phosphatase [Herbaspirillum sp. HC18]|nr:alkaline phosphatase [Herbaspirillum sp. HC18]
MHIRSRISFLFAFTFTALLAGCQSGDRTREEQVKAALLQGKGITVYAAGDIASCKDVRPADSGAAKTAAIIAAGLAADKDAAVLTLGDNTYPVGLLSEFTDCYEPTWGKFKARTFPSPGNHDYYTPKAAGYYSYFGEAAGPGQRGYYSFDLGIWHVISLNSYLKPEAHQAQMAWLRDEIARNTAHCTLAFWHHPIFSSGGHGNDERMREAWNMLYDAGADLVLVSHDHDYERFAPQDTEGRHDEQRGMRQFVVGTGGAKLTPFRFRKLNSEVADNSTHGVLKLVLKDAGYEWEFIPVEKGGFRDRGVALCH